MKNTQKIKNFAVIVLALVMALTIVAVPVFAVANNPFAVINNGATPETTAPSDTTALSGSISNDDVHVCPIVKANEYRHIVECDNCDVYTYVPHDELKASATNAFFHSYGCECGYAYSESHTFATTYNATSHKEVCVDCGYSQEAEPHVFQNDFWGQYHDILCADCGFVAEHHVGVSFKDIDDTSCQASCRQCGIVEVVAHEFYDFECSNCGYVVSGLSYGIVEDIRETDDGYRVRFLVNGNSHRITMENVPDFNEGDFVEIDHYGNVIFDITVMVDGFVVEDPENFSDYIMSDEIYESDNDELVFDDIIIADISQNGEYRHITYQSYKRAIGFKTEYVIYDMMGEEMMDELLEGYAYLTFSTNDRMYFICIW